MDFQEAIQKTKEEWKTNPQLKKDRDEVIAKYGEIFKLENIDNLTQEKFQEFLRFKNNKHWSKLDRPGGNLVKDMDKLKKSLKILLDETVPLADRIKRVRDKESDDYTPFLANAIYTPILLVTNPKKYPIVNKPVVEALDELGLYSIKKWKTEDEDWVSVPEMQEIIQDVASKNDLDLWQVDWVWWKIARDENSSYDEENPLLEYVKTMTMQANFKPIVIKTLSDQEFLVEIEKKLSEEVDEYQNDKNPEELADILEVIYRIAQLRGISKEKLEEIRINKLEKRGAFEKNLFLVDTSKN